ncbi:MAG: response regulator [Proteobacteria bacterium]|nr:response regulator [Pseudomonadota bacterium]
MSEQTHTTMRTEDGSPPILIVEDSMIQAELLRRVLARGGYPVALAKDGVEGLAAARKEPPSLIISDITMPVMNGFEMCRAIRQDAVLKDTPVILLTMLSDSRDVILGLNAGADYYVTKPFNEQYLLSRIKTILTEPPVRGEEKVEMELTLDEQKHRVSVGPQRVLNLLVSTYENAVLQNRELTASQDQLKELSVHLEEKARKLEDANKDLEGFAYSVSHDLRTPLRAIDGFSSLVLKRYMDKLDDEGKRLLKVIRDNTQKMGQLIDDILAFSRMGRLGITPSEIDMDGLARQVFEELKPTAAGRELGVEIAPLPPARGDLAMLRQVWVNLLANAIKFTSHKPAAAIQLGAYPEGRENVFFVKDNGAGFDMQYADKLFGVFQRLHGIEEFEGTGIGLAIVKRIITRHGGRVWAEAKPGEGAAIYFAMPSLDPGKKP